MSGQPQPMHMTHVFSPMGAMGQVQVPQLLFNDATNYVTDTEIVSLITFADRPLVTLIMAPITAKTYAKALLELVEKYERETGVAVPTVDEIIARRAKGSAE